MQTILRALVMLISLWALCPLPIVKVPLGFGTRTYFIGPGFQVRTPETFLWDSICLSFIVEGMFRPLLSGWGSFAFLARLAERCTPSQSSTAGSTIMWVLRCIATLLDVVFISTLVKELARMGLDYHSAQTVITLADINISIAIATQTFLVAFGPRTLLGWSMGLSALPDDVVSGIYCLLVVYGLLSSWGVNFGSLEAAIDLYRVLDAVRVFLAA